jgi:hypothetical protein
VVVGDLIGSGASQEQAIVGETPNLAARLQGIAEPNSVVLAESTHKLVGNLFELEDLGAQELKGVAGPVQAWAALRPSSVEGRFEALHASGVARARSRSSCASVSVPVSVPSMVIAMMPNIAAAIEKFSPSSPVTTTFPPRATRLLRWCDSPREAFLAA